MADETTTVYGLTKNAAEAIKVSRRLVYLLWAFMALVTLIFGGYIISEVIAGKPLNTDMLIACLGLNFMAACLYVMFFAGDNYTVQVTLGAQGCEILDVRGKTVIPYTEVKTLEQLRDFTSQRLYYSFILLGGEGGAELGLIQQSIDNLDQVFEDLSARCQASGANILTPNDLSGPAFGALAAKSRRFLRISGSLAILFFLVCAAFSAVTVRNSWDLRQHGQTVMADITRFEPAARPCISYKFTASDGLEYKGRLGRYLNRDQCLAFSIGGQIPVKYRLADPSQKVGPGESDDLYVNIGVTALFAALAAICLTVKGTKREALIRWRLYRFPVNIKGIKDV